MPETRKEPYVVGGSYFTYKGVKYGVKTRVKFTKEFYAIAGAGPTGMYIDLNNLDRDYRFIQSTWFQGWFKKDGVRYLNFCFFDHMRNIDPDRDIAEIVKPVYYYDPPTPDEVKEKRLKDGTWFLYIWDITLWWVLALLVSLIFKQWYIVWINGTLVYLRCCWIRLRILTKEDYK